MINSKEEVYIIQIRIWWSHFSPPLISLDNNSCPINYTTPHLKAQQRAFSKQKCNSVMLHCCIDFVLLTFAQKTGIAC